MQFVYNDGGRQEAGFKGTAGDCVTRSIAIAAEKPYKEVYDALNELAKSERISKRKKTISSARTGVHTRTIKKYLDQLGWMWVPTMFVGQGCKVHLTDGELPDGRLIVRVSKHITVVIDQIIHDIGDPQRCTMFVTPEGRTFAHRCVYGYWVKK